MFNSKLSDAVQEFAALMLPLSEKDLEHEWIWKDHDEEGIRFAFFVTLQELRHLAVTLAALRSQADACPAHPEPIPRRLHGPASRAPGSLHRRCRSRPAEGEWSVRQDLCSHLGTLRSTLQLRSAMLWKNIVPEHGHRKRCQMRMKTGWQA